MIQLWQATFGIPHLQSFLFAKRSLWCHLSCAHPRIDQVLRGHMPEEENTQGAEEMPITVHSIEDILDVHTISHIISYLSPAEVSVCL